jgi:hypothetical protein
VFRPQKGRSNVFAKENVVDNDTRAPGRTNLLLRQVVVPGWAYVALLVLSVVVTAQLVVDHPHLALLAFVAYVVFITAALVRQRRTRRRSARAAEELHAAPDMRAALTVVWRQMRTQPVWLLIVIALAVVDVVLGWLGLPSI